MTDETIPSAPRRRGLPEKIRDRVVTEVTWATLAFTPRFAADRYRTMFAAGGAHMAQGLQARAPSGIAVVADEPYAPGSDTVLDVYRPAGAGESLPVFMWIHGGGWFGGSKEERAGYCKVIADAGYAVVSLGYSLAPAQRYPSPARQTMAAIGHLRANADRLGVDMSRIVIGGDSAGGQIAAQVGALVTVPGYVRAVGVVPTIGPDQLKGLVLACGFYDLELYRADGLKPEHRRMLKAELWSYSGHRRFLADPLFRTLSVTDYVTADFPPALLTVGNADPLDIHTHRLIERLRAAGAEPETVLFHPDHQPSLEHEYQFDLGSEAGQLFLERTLAFLSRRLAQRR
jgi:acetyl esterase